MKHIYRVGNKFPAPPVFGRGGFVFISSICKNANRMLIIFLRKNGVRG